MGGWLLYYMRLFLKNIQVPVLACDQEAQEGIVMRLFRKQKYMLKLSDVAILLGTQEIRHKFVLLLCLFDYWRDIIFIILLVDF